MVNWHSLELHSAECVEKSGDIGADNRTFSWIRASAEEGCEGCRVAQCAVQKYCEEWIPPQCRAFLTAKSTAVSSDWAESFQIFGKSSLKVKLSGGFSNGPLSGMLEIFTEPGENPSPWPMVGTARIRYNSSDSEGCLSVIRGWIETCTSGHLECSLPEPQYIPYRVIDVGFDGDVVKLCESLDQPDRYIALSYCWGGSVPIVTTKANLFERKSGILTSSLPRTFFNAVQLTRKLGVRYLWIDSLCIIQNDKVDWERESAKMQLVYSNAYLVIAASRGPNSNQRLFHKRNPKQKVAKAFYTGTNSKGDLYTLHARLKEDEPCHTNFHTAIDNLGHFPLLTRTWALQERLLATRILHFTEDELVWECYGGVRCECMYLDTHSTGYFKPRWAALVLGNSPGAVFDTWHMVVETASKLAITKESDRLPSLSGIAHKMQQKGAGTYLAGIWAENLTAGDLLWTVSAATRPKVWRAPSWSWVACEGGDIKFPSRKTSFSKEYYIEINDFSSITVGVDSMGEVASGSITVTGLVAKCLLGRGFKNGVNHHWHERLVYKGQMVCRVICDSGEDADNGPEGLPVYTLLVRRELRNPDSNDPTPFHALVLRRSQGFGGKDKVDGAFERVGIIQFARFWDPMRSDKMARWEEWFEGAEREEVTIV